MTIRPKTLKFPHWFMKSILQQCLGCFPKYFNYRFSQISTHIEAHMYKSTLENRKFKVCWPKTRLSAIDLSTEFGISKSLLI